MPFDINKLKKEAKKVLLKNQKRVQKKSKTFWYTCPSNDKYPWQWFWDSCFHTWGLRWYDIEFAKKEILSLLSGQWSSGFLPHTVHIKANSSDRFIHNTGRDTTGLIQPPIISETVWALYLKEHDISFLKKVYLPLKRYYLWLSKYRDLDQVGLITIYHPWESGADDSPRFDEIFGTKRFRRSFYNWQKWELIQKLNGSKYKPRAMPQVSFFRVQGIDMNCYYYKNLKVLAKIARLLKNNTDARLFRKLAEKTKKAILSKMWSPKDKTFYDLKGKHNKKMKVLSPFSLLPLYAGLVTKKRAQTLVNKLTDNNLFWTPYPVPTVSLSHPQFNPESYWRGTTWVNINWFLIRGLLKYGYKKVADHLISETLKMVSQGGFKEYFNPITGRGLGANDFGWTAALTIDLIESFNYKL